ncbi:MAG: UDP-N-acetylmuramoyl-tripeptide--D-alanyl-D-alanine ligase [Planctomycetes bacterium]|nr:UDP-N-acetylmuramoyl-tripeptide--D-alanyl-D-alanine ligase [Planctomycetota bacterium]
MNSMNGEEVTWALRASPGRRWKHRLIQGISTDSRTVGSGDLFFALKGERFDGHAFVVEALAKGAVGVVVCNDYRLPASVPDETVLIRVADTRRALGDLAQHYRHKLPLKIVAITGSNGKTTTKEMVHHILAKAGKTVATQGNLNNDIGVPFTLFRMSPADAFGVVEMGTSGFGEIARLTEIARPNIGIITSIDEAHLESFGSLEGVSRAKGELVEGLDSQAVAILNADNEWCLKVAQRARCRVVTFGWSEHADVRATDVSANCETIRFLANGRIPVEIPRPKHNVGNALAAIAACRELGIHGELIRDAFRDFHAPHMRFEVIKLSHNVIVVNDAYNANPSSMRSALAEFDEMPAPGRKLLVCGSMLELGAETERLHREVGKIIVRLGPARLWAIGREARFVAESAEESGFAHNRISCFDSVDAATAEVVDELHDNDAVLLKGSRGVKLERLLGGIKAKFG